MSLRFYVKKTSGQPFRTGAPYATAPDLIAPRLIFGGTSGSNPIEIVRYKRNSEAVFETTLSKTPLWEFLTGIF
jgi:hypothetical protein